MIDCKMPNDDTQKPCWRPIILDLSVTADRALFNRLDGIATRHDTIITQLQDLLASRHPAATLSSEELAMLVDNHLASRSVEDYGSWVHYSWLGKIVHILPEGEYRELRSDRNRNKITREEQQVLRQAVIGIVGLSVGQASAVTLALEGIGGAFRLADFDTLALSNLNRLRAGCHELGLNKSVLAARQMFEIDPYLDIEIFPDGVTDATIGRFLGQDSTKLSILVEECDDFYMKLHLRELARSRGIPVIMDTNDRGLIDIERFDLEPERQPFHGLMDGIDSEQLKTMSITEKIPHLMRIIGADAMSPGLAGSLPLIKKTLSTWPQLASGVALGGALVADATRRILLGALSCSGRFYVDVEDLVSDQIT